MNILTRESEVYDSKINISTQSDEGTKYKMVGHGGQGTMTGYQVFPGIRLFYNDFHMGSCDETKYISSDIMEKQCFIMCSKDSIESIFSALYTVPNDMKHEYFKLKVLELLLILSGIDVSERCQERQYFHKSQVEIVKTIKEYMTDDLKRHDTLEELSDNFGIPLTAMKTCFKGVYGNSVFAYMRGYRMQAAAKLLRQGNESVTSIAGEVGYTNPSKFAAAFKDEIGISPLKYRKRNERTKSFISF